MVKIDRRIIKTKSSIRKAFCQLIIKKDFKSITITNIAELADINRKTFYLHYSSVDDILKEFEEELASKVLLLIKDKEALDIGAFFRGLNDIMMEDVELYRRFSKTTTDSFLLIKCKNILKNSITESFYKESHMSSEVFNVYAEYISSGIISIYTDWLNLNSKLTIEELTEIAKNVVSHSFDKIAKYKI
jgi:AcrR family transcriptional regulator